MTSDDIRNNLLQRARSYAERAKSSLSAIGVASVNDSKFLKRVEAGDGFNINTYQRVLDWLDRAELELGEPGTVDHKDGARVLSCPAKSPSTLSQAAAR